MFALIQRQQASYDDEPFDVTIGVYTTNAAAQKAAQDMDDALEAMAYDDPCRHSVQPIRVNTILDTAEPWKHHSDDEVRKYVKHITPAPTGPPCVKMGGVVRVYKATHEHAGIQVEIMPGPASDAFATTLCGKLQNLVSFHDKNKIRQLVQYQNRACIGQVMQVLERYDLTDLEAKFMHAAYNSGNQYWSWLQAAKGQP